MDILVFPLEDVARRAGEALNAALARDFGRPSLVLLSGGSALQILDHVRAELLGPHLTISMADDRVTREPNTSNFGQMAATAFYRGAKERGCAFIDTRPRAQEDFLVLGTRFEEQLKTWRNRNTDGAIVTTQGVGEDGHTCGILPHPHDRRRFDELFDDPAAWAVGYDAGLPHRHRERITVTLPFLRAEVKECVAYAVGREKLRSLEKLMGERQDVHRFPAWVLREMKNATVYTDQEA